MVFILFISAIILQRIIEVLIAQKNERVMKQKGAMEFGQSHYPFIIFVHSIFFLVYIWEVMFFDKHITSHWPVLLMFFFIIQACRLWVLMSLGQYWNTKIIVLPNAKIVRKGPYRYVKHPNYMIVTAEFIIIPLMFQAYLTAILFTILNAVIISIRIPAEEKALKQLTKYDEVFAGVPHFSKDVK